MKRLIFCLALAASTLTCAMQQIPKADKWPAGLPDVWQFSRKISKRFDVQQVIQEIKQAYPRERVDFKGRYVEVDIDDSRENIIKNFKDKPWFSENKLFRPGLINEAHKDNHAQ